MLALSLKSEMASLRLMGNHWSQLASVMRSFSTFDRTCLPAMEAGALGRLSGDSSSTHSVGHSLFTSTGARPLFNGTDSNGCCRSRLYLRQMNRTSQTRLNQPHPPYPRLSAPNRDSDHSLEFPPHQPPAELGGSPSSQTSAGTTQILQTTASTAASCAAHSEAT